MEIKKGDWFRCIENSEYSFIKKGQYYQTEEDGRISVIHSGTNRCHSFEGESIDIHFQKLYTIQDLKDGKVAVDNDGTVEDIINVVKHCFNAKVNGNSKYYFENDGWDSGDRTGLPIQSVKDFLAQLPKKEEAWQPKVGEIVEFKNVTSSTEWNEAEYLAFDEKSSYPYALVYANAKRRFIISSPEIRQVPKKIKVTKQRVADILGIELGQLEIID